MKKILILGNSDSGIFDFRKELLAALVERGYQVHVSVPDTGYISKIESLGVTCIPTVMERRGMNPAKDLKLMKFYRGLLKKIKPDVVFTYTIKPNIYGSLACQFAKIPYFVNITGLGTTLEHEGLLKKLIVFLYRSALKKADCVFFQNVRNRDFMLEAGCISPQTHTRIIPGSGVNLTEHAFLPYPGQDGKIRFLSIMRIMKDKGIEELLEAAGTIAGEGAAVAFDLLGAYEEETSALYEPRIKELEEAGVLKAWGYRDDVPEFLKNCHAVIHPSYHEGMSNVLLEAAATGRPVLASNITGCKETFVDGAGGIAFAPKSSRALADAVRAFLSLSEEDRLIMGRKAREHVEEQFDRNFVVNTYLEELQAKIENE